jgi:hypothetical protein
VNVEVPPSVFRPGSVGPLPGSEAAAKVPVRDVLSEWSESRRVVENSDGSRTLETAPFRLNFKDRAGVWRRIDTRIVPAADQPGVFVNSADESRAEFGP